MQEITTLESKKIEFATEIDAVRLMLKNDHFLATYADYLSPALFRDQLKPVVEISLKYWQQYRKIVPNTVLVQELAFEVGNNLTEEKKQGVLELLYQINKDAVASGYTEQIISDFIRFQRMHNAVKASVAVLKGVEKDNEIAKLEDIPRIINTASQDFTITKPSFFFNGIEERTDYRTKIANKEIEFVGFGTGIPKIDATRAPALGLLRGELGIVIAATGRGKSVALTHFGMVSAFRGFNVVYFSLELPEEMLLNRMDAMVSQTNVSEVVQNRNDIRNYILDYQQNYKVGEVVFHEVRKPGITVMYLKNELTRLKQMWGFVPDEIIIDYMDLMRPVQRVKEGAWKEQQCVSEEIRALGGEFNAAVFSASQGNRGAARKNDEGEELGDFDIAESYNKLFAADWSMTLNRTKEQAKMPEPNPLSIRIVKNRTGIPNGSYKILTSFSKMQFFDGMAPADETIEKLSQQSLDSSAFVEKKKK